MTECVKNSVSLDYEAEYHRMVELNSKLKGENQEYRARCQLLEEEAKILRNQMEVVYLIFGRNR